MTGLSTYESSVLSRVGDPEHRRLRRARKVVHLWRYVGYLIGVDEHILPASEADALRALYHVLATVGESDEDSSRLGQSLAEVPIQMAEQGWLSQRLARAERTLRIGYTRYVLGDRAGDALGLPRTPAKYLWPAQAPLRFGSELLRIALPPLNRALIERNVRLGQSEFQHRARQTRADISFTPSRELVR